MTCGKRCSKPRSGPHPQRRLEHREKDMLVAHTQLLPNFSCRGYGKREHDLNVRARSNGCLREKGGGVSQTRGHPTLALRGAPCLTKACRRPLPASAPASLRLPAAPDAQR